MPGPAKLAIRLAYGDRRLLAAVVLVNVIGSAFGLYYYWDQLMMTPWPYWIFVPDCPLYTFLLVVALIGIVRGRESGTLSVITAVGLAMYGTWTMLVLLYFGEIFFSPGNALMSAALWISHCGMALESILLLPYVKKAGAISWATAAAWFLAQDAMDYFAPVAYAGRALRLHPLAILEYDTQGLSSYAYIPAKLDTMMYVTFAMTAVFIGIVYALSKKWAPSVEELGADPATA